MENMYNAVAHGNIVPANRHSNKIEQASENPIQNLRPSPIQTSPVSKECADALRSITMAQMQLDKKPRYCFVPPGYLQ